MDRINIPTCALDRQSTTVIVRNKMEVSRCSGQSEACPTTDSPKIVHRPSGCERCSRTRLISQYSDCDSGIVEKCRPYKLSAARSRYVNVCAAVCLLLLIGGLSPRSCAAPYRSRTMDRQKRAAEEENAAWRNPCSYNDPNHSARPYSPNTAKKVAQLAKNTLDQASAYKTKVAEWHSFDSFDLLLNQWKDDWLRKFPWVPEEALPADRTDSEYIRNMMGSIDDHLPMMYKALKMIMACLKKLSDSLNGDGIDPDQKLANDLSKTVDDIKTVLCYFYDLMKARDLTIHPLYDSEIPDISKDNMETALYVYRDTLHYLEYLTKVFQIMSEVK